MNELMLMLGLVLSSPVGFEGRLAEPKKPVPPRSAKADLAVARVATTLPVAPSASAVKPKPGPAARRHAILFFTASWCPSCIRMKSETLPFLSLPGHELRIIDFDGNPGLGQSYGIDSLPAYVILDGMGKAYRYGVGYRDVRQFVDFLNGR